MYHVVTSDTVLLKDLLNKWNQMELTAEELSELKQHVLFLNDATSMHKSHRNTLIDIKGQ